MTTGDSNAIRARFPGVRDGWARFDGPAGTQMVDTAIAAMGEWASSGDNANNGGPFAAALRCDELLASARATVGELLGAEPGSIAFGANMTTMTLAFTRPSDRRYERATGSSGHASTTTPT
ncbi:MAG: hypothetical protein WKF58_18125 [Ilumatobacteraceae bacterium]